MHHHLTMLKLCFIILSTRQGGLYRVKISSSPTKPIHSDGLGGRGFSHCWAIHIHHPHDLSFFVEPGYVRCLPLLHPE